MKKFQHITVIGDGRPTYYRVDQYGFVEEFCRYPDLQRWERFKRYDSRELAIEAMTLGHRCLPCPHCETICITPSNSILPSTCGREGL